MNCLPIYPVKPPAEVLQSGPDCCNLQSACKLNLNKINYLFQFADCRGQIAERVCNLGSTLIKSIAYKSFPDCTQTPLYLWYNNQLTFLTSVSWLARQPSIFVAALDRVWSKNGRTV